jgi:hypothetical protein
VERTVEDAADDLGITAERAGDGGMLWSAPYGAGQRAEEVKDDRTICGHGKSASRLSRGEVKRVTAAA